MPPAHQTLRKKKNLLRPHIDVAHGHWLEYFIKVTNVFIGVAFVVGAVFFFYADLTAAGAWIFVIGSAVGVLFNIHDIIEERHTFKIVMGLPRDSRGDNPIEDATKSNELYETVCFAVSGLFFCVGSVLYIPSVSEPMGEAGEAWGAWIFVVGSGGFLFASFFNATGMAASHDETKVERIYIICHKLHVMNLFCQQWGSVLFFTGSFLYRPGLADHCDFDDPSCVDTATTGTTCYVIGGVLFLIDALGSLTSTALRHRFTKSTSQRLSDAEVSLSQPSLS